MARFHIAFVIMLQFVIHFVFGSETLIPHENHQKNNGSFLDLESEDQDIVMLTNSSMVKDVNVGNTKKGKLRPIYML